MNSLNLDEYLYDSYYFQYPVDIEVTSITFNSKEVKAKSIFVAIKGFKVDGNNYIDEAIKNGASLIVTETLPSMPYNDVGFLIVKDARKALSTLSRVLFEFPDKKLKLIGVTGTDGKTTTAYITYKLMKSLNYKVGLISTTNIDTDNILLASPYRQSTPEAPYLFSLLEKCVLSGMEYVVIEATSHALSSFFSRLDGLEFDATIITTITQEHLDFHKSEIQYLKAKLNILAKLKDQGFLVTTKNNNKLNSCIQRAKELNKKAYIVEDVINYKIEENNELKPLSIIYKNTIYPTSFFLPIFISNALLSTLCVHILTKTPIENLLTNLKEINYIKGRFNIIENKINRTIIVDFAHTSDAFEKLLSHLSCLNKRLVILFGSGGERDVHKRCKMGKIAAKYSSTIVLSEEDPRDEDNIKIMNDIEKGIQKINKCAKVYKVDNRKEAIYKMFEISKVNDILLFLGKGHESSIERKGVKYPYDEAKTIKEVIKNIYG